MRTKPTNKQIIDTFADLGKPGNEGLAFAITSKWVRANFRSEPKDLMRHLPRPDYEHRIYFDPLTDNLVVIRGDAKGKYTEWEQSMRADSKGLMVLNPNMERLR